jgi:hypothetical protein
METESNDLSNLLVAAIRDQNNVLREIRDRMTEPPSHHREPTVDPRYELLRGELLTFVAKLGANPRNWAWFDVSQEIDRILAKAEA